jgi:hypothetical protein
MRSTIGLLLAGSRCAAGGRTGRRTGVLMLELLERLGVLTPRPRVNLISTNFPMA